MAFQDITGIQIAQAAVTTGYTTIYTVIAAQRLYIKDIDVCNTTGAAVTFTAHLVPSGSTALVGNALFYGSSIAANDNLQWTGTQIIDVGATIQVKASAVGCTVTISGGIAV
jgi:hypothetical protein